MKDIPITPKVQFLAVAGVVGAVGAAAAAQLPEIRRYLKIKSM